VCTRNLFTTSSAHPQGMNKHVRRGLISLAVAVVSLTVAALPSRAGAAMPPPAPASGSAAGDPIEQPRVNQTVASTVVCDEGMPDVFCRVPVQLPIVNGEPMRLEATTYDRTAIASKDYVPLVALPVEQSDRAGKTEVAVALTDDRECEPVEEFLVVVTGKEIQVITPVSVLDDDC